MSNIVILKVQNLNKTPTLVLGFKGETLTKLMKEFDVRFSISVDPISDIQWESLQYFTIEAPELGVVTQERFDCLDYVKSYYHNFINIYSRRYFYVSGTVSEIYNYFMLSFNQAYRTIKDKNIQLVIFSNAPHEGYDYIYYLIAKFLKIKIIMCNQSLFPNRFWIFSDIEEFGYFNNAPQLYVADKTSYSLPVEWVNMAGSNRDHTYSLNDLLAEIIRTPYRLPACLVRYFYAFNYRKNLKCAMRTSDLSQKYVYFPLHLQPELTTSSLGRDFSDQLSAIEILSNMLPEGFFLYLKENPKQTESNRGHLFFKRIKTLKNVKFVPINCSSIELVKNSQAVSVINGTAGWESLFYNKPVLVFGHAWYGDFKGVTRYTPQISFNDVLINMPPDVSETIEQLSQVLTKTGKGVVDSDYVCLVNEYDAKKNAQIVVESLLQFYSMKFSSATLYSV